MRNGDVFAYEIDDKHLVLSFQKVMAIVRQFWYFLLLQDTKINDPFTIGAIEKFGMIAQEPMKDY